MDKASVGDATDLTKRVTWATEAIEAEFEPLKGVLPKDYRVFENDALEDLLRLFNSEQIRKATSEGLTVDLSQVDCEKLRDEFASKVKRKRAFKDIRELVEAKLAQILAVDPLRMEFYREKNRATVEATFEQLKELAAQLDAGQRRAAEEGLSDIAMALFKVRFKKSVTKAQREQRKQASKSLLALKESLAFIQDWTKHVATQAEVNIRIVDTLWTELPMPPFTQEETDEFARRIYGDIWARTTAEPVWMAA